MFLAGDDPLDRVTDGDQANDFGLLEHGDMAEMALGQWYAGVAEIAGLDTTSWTLVSLK